MIEIIILLSSLSGMAFGIHGIFMIYSNRKEIKEHFGIFFSYHNSAVLLFFFAVIFIFFSILTGLNLSADLVRINTQITFKYLSSHFPKHLSTAILEEFFFRILLFSSLINITENKFLLIVITSLIFSSFHNPESLLYFFSYFLGGVMYGYSFLKFQTILVPIGIHFSWNFIQAAIFGYPVTGVASKGILLLSINPDIVFNGGDQGPEGSVLGIVIRLFLVVIIFLLQPIKSNYKFLKLEKIKT